MIILKIFYFKLPKIILINYKMLIEKQSIIYFRLSKEIKIERKTCQIAFSKRR